MCSATDSCASAWPAPIAAAPPRPRFLRRAASLAAVACALGLLASATAGAAQDLASLPPFAAGERLEYEARVAKVRASGTAVMQVEGPTHLRGRAVLRLRFDVAARLGPVKVTDHTESWLDVTRMAALRFRKQERHPLSTHDEAVELFPQERRWTAEGGRTGVSPTDAPLDELSFLYFLRALPLDGDTLMRFDRHFDVGRSPTTVRVIGRDTIATPAGTFHVAVVELRVKDPRRYRGEGTIRMAISDDPCRLPVRVESQMPVVGAAVLTLRHASFGDTRRAEACRPR